MIIKNPDISQVSQLRGLWLEAFGDDEAFWEAFASTAMHPVRCRCVEEDGRIAAALYWLDCRYMERKVAYLYGVATAKAFRGRGLCHVLMADTHALLEAQGYAGALLVPAEDALAALYETMDYRYATEHREFVCGPRIAEGKLCRVDRAEYARLRREFLPAGGVLQEQENLDFLQTMARFYTGPGFLLAAATQGDTLNGLELLGDDTVAAEIVGALGCSQGRFRVPGKGKPFAMYRPLADHTLPAPTYFGFAFD